MDWERSPRRPGLKAWPLLRIRCSSVFAERNFYETCSSALLFLPQIFPFLQRDRHIAVFPNEIVERAEIEFVAMLHARVGEKLQDL